MTFNFEKNTWKKIMEILQNVWNEDFNGYNEMKIEVD